MEQQRAPSQQRLGEAKLLSRKVCDRNGIDLSDDQFAQLERFADHVLFWNERVNLLSRADSGNIWTSHILHSISLLFAIEIPGSSRILDLGSGGGFPGVPLSIVRSDLLITLLDSIRKKVVALQDIVGDLGLNNVSVILNRAEALTTSPERFDIVIARAVAPLADLIKWSKPLVEYQKFETEERSTGKRRFKIPFLVAMKGGDLDAEVRAARLKTGQKKIAVVDLTFPGSAEAELEEKKLVVVEF